MDEERFNLSLRKLLKQFGVTAQRRSMDCRPTSWSKGGST
jgi:hypothetical protein